MSKSFNLARRERWLTHLVRDGAIATPALVIDAAEVRGTLDLFERFVPQAKLFYAVKANNDSKLLEYLAGQGISFDVASAREIKQLVSLGVPASRMVFSNPIKSPAAIRTFYEQGLRLVVIDNLLDLNALAAARPPSLKPLDLSVFVRIRIVSTDVQIDLNSKFGCFEHEAVTLLKAVADAGFNPRGVHFHVGTQSWNARNYRTGVDASLAVLDGLQREFGIRCDSINIGGGFPDPVLAKEAGGLESFFTSLAQALKPAVERGLNILAEPGRILVSGACSAVCSVIGKSIRNGTPWLYLDDGAYGLFSGKFFDHKQFDFHVLQQNSPAPHGETTSYVVAGPTCDSIDVVAQPLCLPANLLPGDVLCSHNMGAYSLVTVCGFNGFGEISSYLGTAQALQRVARPDGTLSEPKFLTLRTVAA